MTTKANKMPLRYKHLRDGDLLCEYCFLLAFYLTIRHVTRKGYGAIAHEAKTNGLLILGP